MLHANTAAVGQLFPCAAQAMIKAIVDLANPEFYSSSYIEISRRSEECRVSIARLLSEYQSYGEMVSSEDIALVGCTSDGIASLLESFACGLPPRASAQSVTIK